ncbi:MAG: 1-pyrroline-5-carboxylate dehydrogenase, partial [Gaiellales bacterium]|nr:1-pyrroline-5-carboxylate dehydrogenase [Gaiellales bacterium]
MSNGIFKLPPAFNEPIRDYAPGSPERASLKVRLAELSGQQIE